MWNFIFLFYLFILLLFSFSLSSFCTRSMVSTEPVFKPFVSAELFDAGPWLPFSLHNDGAYESFRRIYEQYTANGVRGKALEKAAENTLKIWFWAMACEFGILYNPRTVGFLLWGIPWEQIAQGFMEYFLMICLSLWSAPSLMIFGTPEF